jgi:glutaredoxin-like protein NrdH
MESVNYLKVPGSDNTHEITVYSLTTCPHCNAVKQYLKDKGLSFKYLNMDEATHDEKREVTLFLKAHKLQIAFPMVIIDEKVLQGFDVKMMENYLGQS